MGALRRRGSATRHYLHQNHSVGRAEGCDLLIDRRAVSSHHATLRWVEGAWTLRDHASRNGTYVNGRRIESGQEHAQILHAGDLIGFAERDEQWELVDASPPAPQLVPLDDDGEPITLDDHDMLALPSADEPLVTIFRRSGRWWAEQGGEAFFLDHGHHITAGSRSFRLHAAASLPSTADAESQPAERRLRHAILEIRVSADEEAAEARVQIGSAYHELPRRSFLYLLAFLARRRLDDAGAHGEDSGWVDVESACHELQLASPEALTLLVHRCRKELQKCGIEDPAEIIDRSRRGLIRIGVKPEQLSVISPRTIEQGRYP